MPSLKLIFLTHEWLKGYVNTTYKSSKITHLLLFVLKKVQKNILYLETYCPQSTLLIENILLSSISNNKKLQKSYLRS